MGTVFQQPVRDRLSISHDDILMHVHELTSVAETAGVSLDQVVAVWRVLEMSRANDLAADNGDIHDEQMAGFAGILETVSEGISNG